MPENSGIDGTARALSPGCGNGNTAKWRCCSTVAHATGFDLSMVDAVRNKASSRAEYLCVKSTHHY